MTSLCIHLIAITENRPPPLVGLNRVTENKTIMLGQCICMRCEINKKIKSFYVKHPVESKASSVSHANEFQYTEIQFSEVLVVLCLLKFTGPFKRP